MAGRELSDRNEGRPTIEPTRAWFLKRLTAAIAVGLLAFVCYWHTLLPGLDFGDTASFQTGVGSLTLTPRQAYPLYYALGNIVAWLDPHEPAHAMNLASAIYGALAAAVAVWVGAEIAGAVIGGVAAGLLLAFSYTFWTQAIIAEVYTLHLLIVGLCLIALLTWARKPTLGRLAVFYALYALGFGNHLSMILLLPGFTLFILWSRPHGADDPVRPKAIAMALGIALFGALQYAWNFRGMWLNDSPPSSPMDALGRFWFDVTKADWRETLVMHVSEAGLQNRPAMYWFDLHQQFGTPGVLLAGVGFIFLVMRRRRIGMLLFLLYLANLLFAWTYNVGDVHVFFLPSHYIVALCAGAGGAALMERSGGLFVNLHNRASRAVLQGAIGAACLLYVAWRGYDTFPAVDRSWDHRPEQLLEHFARPPVRAAAAVYRPLAIFGVDTNWQVQNGFEYFMRHQRPEVAWFTFDDLAWLNAPKLTPRFQHFCDVNAQAGREIVVTPDFARKLRARGFQGSFDDLDALESRVPREATFAAELSNLHPGTTYALGLLRPYREYPINQEELVAAWSRLTDGSTPLPPISGYTIVVGELGRAPVFVESRDRPFRVRTIVQGAAFDIRMESWLPTDTIRRAGFGQVIVNRGHVLTLDRGVSFVALGPLNEPSIVIYRSALFAPIPRLLPWTGPGGYRQ